MQKANFKIIFDRKKQVPNRGKGLLEIYIYISPSQKKYISTKIWVKKEEWDKKKSKVNAKHPNYLAINSFLKDQINEFESAEYEIIKNGGILTADKLNQILSGNSAKITFNHLAKEKLKGQKLKYESYRSDLRNLEILDQFDPAIPFSNIDYQLIERFDQFIRDFDYSDWYRWKIHKTIKKFILLAVRYGYLNYRQNPYLIFKVQRPRSKQDYLSPAEIASIEKADLNQRKDLIFFRKLFLFQCYTGLRFSDLAQLSGKNVFERDGKLVLLLDRMQKVDTRVFLRLEELFSGRPAEIIRPFFEEFNNEKNIWGRKITNQEMNRALKLIGAEAWVKKKLTTHLGRHTFGTLYAKETGSIFEVMKAMGISKFETAQVYINLSDEI